MRRINILFAFLLLLGCTEKKEIKEAERFCNEILSICKIKEYEMIVPFLSEDIIQRHKDVEYDQFLEIIKNDFPHDFVEYRINHLDTIEDSYFVEIGLDNGIFNMFFQKHNGFFKINKIELYYN